MGRRLKPAVGILLGVPLGLLAVLVVQALVARGRDYPFEAFQRIEAVARPASGANGPALRMAMLGDSTVAGVGVPTEQESLPVLTAERVAAALGRPVEVMGFGVSGAETGEVLEMQGRDLEAFDVVVVVIGSNDVTHGTSPWRLRADTRALLAGLPKPVVFGGIPLFGGTTAIDRPLRDVVRWYAGVLRRVQVDVAAEFDGVAFVNIAERASPRFRGVPEAMSSDGFHPAPVGYGFWADALAADVLAVLDTDGLETSRHM